MKSLQVFQPAPHNNFEHDTCIPQSGKELEGNECPGHDAKRTFNTGYAPTVNDEDTLLLSTMRKLMAMTWP
jgi:hypothetical protein